MNRVLPRISLQSGRNRRIIISTPSIHPNVGQRGGISGRTILSSVGIKRGEIVRVREGNLEAEREAIEEAAKRKAEKEALEAKQREAERLAAERMTAKEERLADLLEAAQEMKPLADGMMDDVAEEQANATEPYDDPEYMKEQIAEETPQPEPLQEEIVERAAVIPEEKHTGTAIAVEHSRKKKRGRKGKKARAAMMAAEQELL